MKNILSDPLEFSAALHHLLAHIHPGIKEMELYEFRYCLDPLTPSAGWAAVALDPPAQIEDIVGSRAFYDAIQIKPRLGERIVLDERNLRLTQMLFAGLVSGVYPVDWIKAYFYFDIRGFLFLHRTTYFTEKIRSHFGGTPYRQFEPEQLKLAACQEIGYKAFARANAAVDGLFIDSVKKIIAARGTPILLAIAGPTAAGKTEIVERLHAAFRQEGKQTASIEMDNFLTDRDERERKGIFTQGKKALHFSLFLQSLEDITHGKRICIPRYDFVFATSSHNRDGTLKPGGRPIEIDPADIVFIEGNFPFLLPEVSHLIGIKVVYLTDDPVRLKRKWKRDIDYRKKYDPAYLCNRFFKEQFIMAEIAYRPQLEVCDLAVDTSGAALWATPEMRTLLSRQ